MDKPALRAASNRQSPIRHLNFLLGAPKLIRLEYAAQTHPSAFLAGRLSLLCQMSIAACTIFFQQAKQGLMVHYKSLISMLSSGIAGEMLSSGIAGRGHGAGGGRGTCQPLVFPDARVLGGADMQCWRAEGRGVFHAVAPACLVNAK